MLILIRCNDIVSDPRAMKYVRYMQKKDIKHRLIGWDRDNINPDLQNAVYFKQPAGFNVGGLKAVKNRIAWMWYVYKTLCTLKAKDVVLHGCDLDSAFPAVCYKITHKRIKVIFDIFDWFSATLYRQSKYILSAFKLMEKMTVSKSDYFILCEEERIEQIPYKLPQDKVYVFPNIPSFETTPFLMSNEKFDFGNNLPVLSYVGGLVYDRCLDEIINLATKGKANLLIAGFGNETLVQRLNSLSQCPNIKYFGKVKYTDGLNIMYNSDVVYAMYSTRNPNHVYAAPNKYYEAIFLGKPLFTTKGTIVQKKVVSNALGYISGESEDEILSVIETFDVNDFKEIGSHSKFLWINKYCRYTEEFLENSYHALIQY